MKQVDKRGIRQKFLRLSALLLGASLSSACMNARIDQSRHTMTGLDSDEAVVVLARSLHNGNETENKFIDCVDKALAGGNPPLRVISDDVFRDSFYPWFEPRTAPRAAEDLPAMLSEEALATKLRKEKVRYLVWIEGSTEAHDGGGGISCAAGPGAAGCVGLVWWEKDSSYEASIWDLENSSSAGQVTADVNGMSVVPALIVPVPMIAPTQGKACRQLAEQLRNFLVQGVS
ncbi:MAG: hypothetical protein WBP60_00835 [Gammaproteobacteria bacterium]